MSKRKTQRPGWPFNKTTATSKEFIDYDYLNKLSPEELQWLETFTKAEYLNDHKSLAKITGKKPSKTVRKKYNRKDYRNRTDAFHRSTTYSDNKSFVKQCNDLTGESLLLIKEEITTSQTKK